MSDPLTYFLEKFREIWRDSKDARIILECHAGQASISLHHRLPSPPPFSPPPPHRWSQPSPSCQPRKPGPSRLRRRARREEARRACKTAENAVNDISSKLNANVAEDATASDAAVQAADPLPAHKNLNVAAEQASQQPSQAAEQVFPQQVSDFVGLNVDARPWPHGEANVQDVFCPDHHYLHQPHLPQAPRNQCSICGKTFGSERALSNHVEKDHKLQES